MIDEVYGQNIIITFTLPFSSLAKLFKLYLHKMFRANLSQPFNVTFDGNYF